MGAGPRWEQGIDPSTGMARPASIGTVGVTLSGTPGAGDWNTGSYSYDAGGNISAMGSETYTYDTVSRLVSSTRGGGENYTFDPFGNLTSMNGLPRTTDPATNRLTSASYDRRGNLLGWGDHTFTWDTLGRMTSMQGPGIHRSMFYDAKGERLVVRDGSTYTFTLRDLAQQVVREVSWSAASGWRWGKDFVYRDGVLLASHSLADGLRYHFPDHLTSPRLVANRCGERVMEHRTSSFGLDLLSGSAQSPDRMRFTMHERDLGQLSTTLDDLDVMHARYHNPNLGRFLSVDPYRPLALQTGDVEDRQAFLAFLGQPGNWNAYAYARGNPIRYVDPDGKTAEEAVLTLGPLVGAGGLTAPAWLAPVVVAGAGAAAVYGAHKLGTTPAVSQPLTSAFETALDLTVFRAGNYRQTRDVIQGLMRVAEAHLGKVASGGGPDKDPDFKHHQKEIKAFLDRALKLVNRLPTRQAEELRHMIMQIAEKAGVAL